MESLRAFVDGEFLTLLLSTLVLVWSSCVLYWLWEDRVALAFPILIFIALAIDIMAGWHLTFAAVYVPTFLALSIFIWRADLGLERRTDMDFSSAENLMHIILGSIPLFGVALTFEGLLGFHWTGKLLIACLSAAPYFVVQAYAHNLMAIDRLVATHWGQLKAAVDNAKSSSADWKKQAESAKAANIVLSRELSELKSRIVTYQQDVQTALNQRGTTIGRLTEQVDAATAQLARSAREQEEQIGRAAWVMSKPAKRLFVRDKIRESLFRLTDGAIDMAKRVPILAVVDDTDRRVGLVWHVLQDLRADGQIILEPDSIHSANWAEIVVGFTMKGANLARGHGEGRAIVKKRKRTKNVGIEFSGPGKIDIGQIVNQPKGPVVYRLSAGNPAMREALDEFFKEIDRVLPALPTSPAKEGLAVAVNDLVTADATDLPPSLRRVLALAKGIGAAAAPILRAAESLQDLINS